MRLRSANYAIPTAPEYLPPPAVVVNEIVVDDYPKGEKTRVFVELVGDGLATGVRVPVLVARGRRPGPVFGITAAVHGNELNGIRVIHDLFANLELAKVRGTIVAVVVANVPGLHRQQREFNDGVDLNRIMPGEPDGNLSQVYAHRLLHRVVAPFNFLVDLHTASFGRVNSLYVRADMTDEVSARMAYLQRPQIIVHKQADDSTVRGAAMGLGIPSITVEIGDPQRFQRAFARSARVGLRAVLDMAGVLKGRPTATGPDPVLCDRSGWMYTDRGGLLEVLPEVNHRVKKGDVVARVHNAFGDLIRSYDAAADGVVIGKSSNPIGQTGARILHLGQVADAGTSLFVRRPDA